MASEQPEMIYEIAVLYGEQKLNVRRITATDHASALTKYKQTVKLIPGGTWIEASARGFGFSVLEIGQTTQNVNLLTETV